MLQITEQTETTKQGIFCIKTTKILVIIQVVCLGIHTYKYNLQ